MSFKYRLFLLLTAILLAAFGSELHAQAENSAGDLFYKGYTLKSEAEKLEQAGDINGAIAKFQQAQQAISAVAQNFPTWQPEVVTYRLRLIEQSIARLSRQAAPPAYPPTAAPVSPLPPGPAMQQPAYPTPQTLPYTPPPANIPSAPPVAGGTANPLEIINQQFETLQRQNAEYKEKLRLYEDGYTNALRERQKAQQDSNVLKQQLDELMGKVDTLSKQANSKDAATQQEINKVKNEAQMVREVLEARGKELEDNNKVIESLKKEKDALVSTNKKLEEELKKAKEQAVKPDDFNKLLAENTRLKKELDEAKVQVESMKAEGVKKDQEVLALRNQLTSIQSEVAKLRQENTSYQGQVADLTMKLKEVNAQLAGGPSPSSPEGAKLAEENKALRTIIMRQLRQQQRQLQAKEIVLAEMKKIENTSQLLIENLEDMTSGKVRITLDEESLFSEPELREIFAASGGVYATLQATATGSNSRKEDTAENSAANNSSASALPLPSETPPPGSAAADDEEGLMAKASEALRANDLKAAEWAYQDALRANPKNTVALTNLAGIKMQGRQYEEAEILLQKCLVYTPDNDIALYRLGICYFHQSKLNEAFNYFERSLTSNKDNARAHHYLGIITTRQGNRTRAETEFKSALAIDPTYGDAHFNLAVLYATSTPPDWNQARKHYTSALERGIKADPAMDRLLNQPGIPSPVLQTSAR